MSEVADNYRNAWPIIIGLSGRLLPEWVADFVGIRILNRDKAVDKMFLIILEKCYEDVKHSAKMKCCKNLKNMIIEAMAIAIK